MSYRHLEDAVKKSKASAINRMHEEAAERRVALENSNVERVVTDFNFYLLDKVNPGIVSKGEKLKDIGPRSVEFCPGEGYVIRLEDVVEIGNEHKGGLVKPSSGPKIYSFMKAYEQRNYRWLHWIDPGFGLPK